MQPGKFPFDPQSNVRKSRPEIRPSMLPKPVRPASIDRQSLEPRLPSTTVTRSSSADPPRSTYGPRPGRDASAMSVVRMPRPFQGETSSTSPSHCKRYTRTLETPTSSRSQAGDKYLTTPLRTGQYSRTTTTPRTPSEDRGGRNWQACVERALSFVTKKDERPITDVAWQRAEFTRVSQTLASWWARVGPEGESPLVLVRPLTIARFVEITGALLSVILGCKITTDNYVAKLPHLSKRLLYPGTVAKGWLKTVNTPHGFPQGLALISYLLDIATYLETPAPAEWLYASKDELFALRRNYIYKCWVQFQVDPEYAEINKEYLGNLNRLLGTDDGKIAELETTIKSIEESLDDKVEQAARMDEERRAARVAEMRAALQELRAESGRYESDAAAERQRGVQLRLQREQVEREIEAIRAECQRLRADLEQQGITVTERDQLLDGLNYRMRVLDTKRTLLDQITKMIQSKERELELWQKKTLECCLEYKQGLIQLSAQFPELADFAVDEKDLMEPEWAERVAGACNRLRELSVRLAEQRADLTYNRSELSRKRAHDLEETNKKIAEVKAAMEEERIALDQINAKESAAAADWTKEQQGIKKKMNELRVKLEEFAVVERDLQLWEERDAEWREKLSEMEEYVKNQQEKAVRLLESAKSKRAKLFVEKIDEWKRKLADT